MTEILRRGVVILGAVLLAGCTGGGVRAPARSAATQTTITPSGAPREELAWATFSPATFAKAKAERKFIVLDGSAEWCHWCHVMEATTYHDPDVRAVLDRHFVAVKVDIDSRPDLAERYGDYGWPATVVFSPDAIELGKYRGYIPPEKFVEILREVVKTSGASLPEAGADPGRAAGYLVGAPREASTVPLSEEHLAWIERATEVELDDYWDPNEGGWGRTQKAPLGYDNAWLLARAFVLAPHDDEARRRVLFTLDKQSRLIDPVWGGIYQYSTGGDWEHPHFEKLMTFQAPALENYADAYRFTHDPKQLGRARLMLAYLDRFMKSPEGGFYTTQDADLNAHERDKPFLDGHAYYALGDKDRLARGVPRIDRNEYGRENGIAIAAYAAMYAATGEASTLGAARTAARHILATHTTKRGGIAHGAFMSVAATKEEPKQLFLSDNAAFGWGLMRLYEVETDTDERRTWLERSKQIADFLVSELGGDAGGGLFASTKDPDAVGIFATRRVPFEENVMALRFLARLARATNDPKYATTIARVLRAISTPEEIKGRGRMLGDYLLALEETKAVRGVTKK